MQDQIVKLEINDILEPQGLTNFQLFHVGKITGKYSTPVTLVIAMLFIRIKFHQLILHQPLEFSISCHKIFELKYANRNLTW